MGMGQPGRPGMPQGNQAPNQQQMQGRFMQRPMMLPNQYGMARMGNYGVPINQQGTPLTPQGVPSPAMWGTRPNLQGQPQATPGSAISFPSMMARMAGRPMVQMQPGQGIAAYPQMQQLQVQAQQAQRAQQAQAAQQAQSAQQPQVLPQMQPMAPPPSLFGGDDPSMDAWRRSMGAYMPGYIGGSANGASGNGTGGVGNAAATGVGAGGSAAAGVGGDDGGTYARGGRVRGSMRPMANQMANMGRFGDQNLVHMAPRELRTLQQLNGGRPLPRNPQTGLPEAFGLGDIFSAIGGIVGSFIAPGIGTGIGAGLGSLGGQAIEGKGVDFGKGILSGLLGYGLGSAVGALGAEGALGGALGGAESGISGFASGAGPIGPSGGALAPTIAEPAATGALNVPAGQAVTGGAASSAPSFTDTLTRAGQNLTNPDALWQTFGKGFMKTTLPIVSGAYGLATTPDQQGLSPAQAIQEEQKSSWYRTPSATTRTQVAGPTNPDPRGYEQTYFNNNRGWTFMADGGRVGYAGGGPIRGLPPAGGRYIGGSGDGLADAIPAVVDGREPARLSSGEWVAPAHLVSALGNGSTEAGVRQLDGMADRVMQRKYGTTSRRPGPVNARRFMPA